MILSEASERALELPQLLALLAQLCATDLGMERALALRPTDDRAWLERRRLLADEARRLLEGATLVASRERPLRPILDALLRFGGDLDGRSLVEIGAVLEITTQGIERIRKADPPCPTWQERVRELPRLDHVSRQIRQIFDARGEKEEK